MCMEDVRIQRATYSQMSVVSTSAAAVQLVSGNAFRTAIVVSPPDTNDIYVSDNKDTLSASNGIYVKVGTSPLSLELLKHGDIVRRGLYVLAPGGKQAVTVIETFLDLT